VLVQEYWNSLLTEHSNETCHGERI